MKKINYDILGIAIPLVIGIIKHKVAKSKAYKKYGSMATGKKPIVHVFQNELGERVEITIAEDPKEYFTGLVITVQSPNDMSTWRMSYVEAMNLMSTLSTALTNVGRP